jgi:hypothetical protein
MRQRMIALEDITQPFNAAGDVVINGLLILRWQVLVEIGNADTFCAP